METLSKLEGIPLESWWCTGRHQEWGEVTLLEQASYFAAHELTHLRQINTALARRDEESVVVRGYGLTIAYASRLSAKWRSCWPGG